MDNSSRRVSPAPRTRQSIIWLDPAAPSSGRGACGGAVVGRGFDRAQRWPARSGIAPTRLCTLIGSLAPDASVSRS